MGAKSAIKIILTCLPLLCQINTVSSQTAKHLLFDSSKDSVVTIEENRYYKIENNLFDVGRYNEIDTINKNQASKVKLTSVKELWEEGKRKIDSITDRENRLKTGSIYISDTHNNFFQFIYILEKLPTCQYKRTRVWWIDY